MQDEMTRGRSQVIWRYMPHSTFRYNGDDAWCEVTDVTMNKPSELTGALVDALMEKLSYWNALGPTGFPNPRSQSNKYIVGEPYWVRYEIWPAIFVCTYCNVMHWYNSVARLKQVNDRLKCRSCGKEGNALRQAQFAYVCPCGSIQTLFIPKCRKNNDHHVCLFDAGNFQESYWYCYTCKTPLQGGSQDGLGIRACQCGKPMRGVTLVDPRAYYSQTLAIVDIQPEILTTWKENENFATLLLGAFFKIPSYKSSDIQNLSRYKSSKGGIPPELVEMKRMLLGQGMPEEQVNVLINKSMEKASPDPWTKYVDDLKDCNASQGTYDPTNSRQTIEYIFVRDEASTMTVTLDRLISDANLAGDAETCLHHTNAKTLALNLGLTNMAVIQELPILLAGIGYSRFFPSPIDFDGTNSDAKLKPYKLEENGKVPIYIAKNTTEAFMYELDPWRLASFLEVNGIIVIPSEAKKSDSAMRVWLYSFSNRLRETGESHLQLLSFERERDVIIDVPTAFIFGVLHTISHALKATAHQYVGIDQDSLAEYLFPLHLSGLLYVSSHVQFTLGGIDAVFRSNLSQWLGTVRDFTNSCSFDPVCRDDGGACLACLYTKFGCNYFNRSLSRSFLFGGKIRGFDRDIIGFWSHAVTEHTEKIRNKSS